MDSTRQRTDERILVVLLEKRRWRVMDCFAHALLPLPPVRMTSFVCGEELKMVESLLICERGDLEVQRDLWEVGRSYTRHPRQTRLWKEVRREL